MDSRFGLLLIMAERNITRLLGEMHIEEEKEICTICLEECDTDQIFSVDVCRHRYCSTCIKRYVERHFLLGRQPICPHQDCESVIKIDACEMFFAPERFAVLKERIAEGSILASQRLYCPNPRCSAAMSKKDLKVKRSVIVSDGKREARECIKCHEVFCINCKVPWHRNKSCYDYERQYPLASREKVLFALAKKKGWRMCALCNQMIEHKGGCNHMTCSCKYEFCFDCGTGYEDGSPTCEC